MVYGLTGLLSYMIPDVPSGVRTQIKREKLLAREVLFDSELNNSDDHLEINQNSMNFEGLRSRSNILESVSITS